jgi:hypothetical protein
VSSQSFVQAHGIGANAADSEPWEFIQFGFEHMLLGWDHLLFIAGVIIVCRNWWLAAKMITIFVVGHSATLVLASGLGWGLEPTLVDLIIAISVLFVGGWALAGRPADLKVFGSVVFGFGLIHGLGLAARLDEVGLPSGSYLKVIAFNVGIELGQLTAVLAIAALTYVGSKLVTGQDTARLVLSGGVVAGGAIACVVVLLAIVNPPLGEPTRLALSERSSCELTERTREFGTIGKHPDNIFTEPDQPAPIDDFGHTMGDGFVIVLYPQDLPAEDLDTLRTYVTSEKGEFVLAGPNPVASDKIEVHNLYETLTCDELEMGPLVDYRNLWIKSVEEDLA